MNISMQNSRGAFQEYGAFINKNVYVHSIIVETISVQSGTASSHTLHTHIQSHWPEVIHYYPLLSITCLAFVLAIFSMFLHLALTQKLIYSPTLFTCCIYIYTILMLQINFYFLTVNKAFFFSPAPIKENILKPTQPLR